MKKVNISAFNAFENLLNNYSPDNRLSQKRYLRKKKCFMKELSKYLNFLHQFEGLLLKKKKNNNSLQKFFNEKANRIISAGDLLLKEIASSSIQKRVKELFRKCIGKWAYQSQIIRRSFEKPRGYAGDYEIIEMFYNYKPMSKGIGYYFDRCMLSNTLATADIYRKDKMVELLKDFIERSNSNKLEIINFGCGGCKELRDLFSWYFPNKKLNFVAIDQDLEALKFSKSFVNEFPSGVSIKFLHKNIIDLIKSYRHKNPKPPLTNKQLTYSIGLVDYFADNVLSLFVRLCLKTLSPGGQLIFAHKNKQKRESFLAPDWICDWRFYLRNKGDVLKLIKNEITGCDLRIQWEKTHHMFFFIITKKAC